MKHVCSRPSNAVTTGSDFYARLQNASRVLTIDQASVRLFVCLSHSWTVSKRCKL